jgi:hypothetical protein
MEVCYLRMVGLRLAIFGKTLNIRDRVCVCTFIRVSVCACMWTSTSVLCFLKKKFEQETERISMHTCSSQNDVCCAPKQFWLEETHKLVVYTTCCMLSDWFASSVAYPCGRGSEGVLQIGPAPHQCVITLPCRCQILDDVVPFFQLPQASLIHIHFLQGRPLSSVHGVGGVQDFQPSRGAGCGNACIRVVAITGTHCQHVPHV